MTTVDRAGRIDAQQIADAVLGVDSVVSMSGGPMGQFRSYVPGGTTVAGVRIEPGRVDVNVVSRYGPDLAALGRRIRQVIRPLVGGRSITVGIDDVMIPGDAADSRSGTAPDPAPGRRR